MRDQWLMDRRLTRHELGGVRTQLENLGVSAAHKHMEPPAPWFMNALERELTLMEALETAKTKNGGLGADDIFAQLERVREKLRRHRRAELVPADKDPEGMAVRKLSLLEAKLMQRIADLDQRIAEFDAGTHPEAVRQQAETNFAHDKVLYSLDERERAEFKKEETHLEEQRFQDWKRKRRGKSAA